MGSIFVVIRLLFHTISTAIYVVGILKFPSVEVIKIINDLSAKKHNLTLTPEATYGGSFKFLTFWDVALQASFFALCSLRDIYSLIVSEPLPSTGKQNRSKKSTPNYSLLDNLNNDIDQILYALVFPIGVFTVVSFWLLYAIDREAIHPSALEAFFPPYVNHIVHTIALPVAIVELRAFGPHALRSRARSMLLLLVFMTGYLSWVHYVAARSGVWPYELFQGRELHEQLLIQAGFVALALILWLVGLLAFYPSPGIWSEHDEHKEARDVDRAAVHQQKLLMQATRGTDEPDAANSRPKRARKPVKKLDD